MWLESENERLSKSLKQAHEKETELSDKVRFLELVWEYQSPRSLNHASEKPQRTTRISPINQLAGKAEQARQR